MSSVLLNYIKSQKKSINQLFRITRQKRKTHTGEVITQCCACKNIFALVFFKVIPDACHTRNYKKLSK